MHVQTGNCWASRNQCLPQILKKAETAPSCKDYAFQIDDGRFWDPTDAEGAVSSKPGDVVSRMLTTFAASPHETLSPMI